MDALRVGAVVEIGPARTWRFARAEPALLAYGAALLVGVCQLLYAPLVGEPMASLGNLRYVPHLLALLALLLDIAGDRLALQRLAVGIRGFWPLAVLGAWIAGSALYARVQLGQQDTYLSSGLAYLGFFIAYPMAAKLGDRPGVPLPLRALPLGALAAYFLVPVTFALHRPLLHEAAYLFIPWLAYAMLRPGPLRRAVQLGGAVALLLVGPLSLKNTATVVAALTLAGVYVAANARRWGVGRTFAFVRTWALTGVVGGALLAAWALAPRPAGFSSGNAEFRLYIYQARWNQFIDSPLIGQAWLGPPYIRFTLFEMTQGTAVANNAVTHNDHLDLLANGGLIAAALMLAFYVMLARRVAVHLQRGELAADRYALIATLALCAVGGLFTMGFNPVLANPINGFMLWSTIGLLAGYAHRPTLRSWARAPMVQAA